MRLCSVVVAVVVVGPRQPHLNVGCAEGCSSCHRMHNMAQPRTCSCIRVAANENEASRASARIILNFQLYMMVIMGAI